MDTDDHLMWALEAELVAATHAPEVASIAQAAETPEVAVRQVMERFALSEAQAGKVLDAQFRVATAGVREKLESEIRKLADNP